jgi:putative hydrolase of the HAD superfamily
MAIDLKPFKNIIFDLGGVILNIDYNLSVEAFKKLGLNNFSEHFSQAQQKQLFDLYEKGQISSDEFRVALKKELGASVSHAQIDDAWNALLQDLPVERLHLLQRLKNTHRTFLLSNTNEIHILEFEKYLQSTFGLPNLASHFEKLYLSYKVGMRKPDAEIFELVLQENQLHPKETLFIDDSIQHIESAQSIGIQTYWLQKPETIVDLFMS